MFLFARPSETDYTLSGNNTDGYTLQTPSINIDIYGKDVILNQTINSSFATLSGEWYNGEAFEFPVEVRIPEPCTILLLGLGGSVIRFKRKE